MKNLLLASASLLLVSAVPAMAADVVEEVAYEAPVAFDWTGGYIGVHAGYLSGDTDYDVTSNGFGFGFPSDSVDVKGGFGGVQVGYNFQSGSFVYGIEADFSLSGADGFFTPNDDDGYAVDLDWFGTARLRAGAAFDRLLVYGTGGLAVGRASMTLGDVDLPGPVFDPGTGIAEDSDTAFGWTAGAGAEYAFTDRLTFKAEYLYVDLSSLKFNGFDTATGNAVVADADTDFHTVRVGLNYKF
jgi:outer membrane immunogenic protein